MRREGSAAKKDVKQLLRTLDKGLKTLRPEDLLPRTPCIDSWALASYVTGGLDEEAQRKINSHIAFCDSCFEEFVALAGREKIAEIFLNEKRAPGQEPSKTDFWQEALAEGLSAFVSPNETYGAGTFLVMFPTVLHGKGAHSKVREVSAGENTYRVAMSVSPDGAVTCDITALSIPLKAPLHVYVSSPTRGENFISTKTDADGKGHVFVSGKRPDDILLIFIFTLREQEQMSVSGARKTNAIQGMMTAFKALRRKIPHEVAHAKEKL